MNKNLLHDKEKTPAKILIVEDEMIVAKDMQETLKARGYIVTAIVNSGRDAIKMVKKERPDLVLMDIMLKGKMDGIDTAGRIRTKFAIPIIFITAFTNDDILQRAMNAEPYAYIVKPLDSSELYTNIEMALYKHVMDQKLRESEERLKTIFDNVNDGILLADIESKQFHDGNTGICEMLGYNLKELQTLGVSDIHPKSDLPYVTEQIEKQIRKEIKIAQNIPVKRKDGSVFYADVNSSLIKIGGKRYLIGIFRDTTQRRQEEEERKKSMYDMNERLKELQCMYGVSRSISERATLEEVLQDIVLIFPPALQHPKITRVKILFDNREYINRTFEETEWKLIRDIIINGEKRGSLEVYYLEQQPQMYEGPFTKEECSLIDGIVHLLGEVVTRKQIERDLHDSEEKLNIMISKAVDAIIIMDNNGKVTLWNQAAQKIFGYSPEEIIGVDLHLLLAPIRYHEDFQKGFRKFKLTGQGNAVNKTLELIALRKDGSEFPVELSMSAVKIKYKWHAIGFIRDITERKKIEEKIIRLASFPEQDPNPVIEIAGNGIITYMNDSARSHFPNIHSLSSQHPILKNLKSHIDTLTKQGRDSISREVSLGNQVYEEKICYFPESKLARIFVYEITQRKKLETDLRKQSLIDQLTGLYNRRGFHTLVGQQMYLASRTKKGFYVLFADIDRMKWINDNFGHYEGDLALQKVAASCKNSFRKSDIIARLGGDEFAICAIEAKKDSAEILMKRLRKNLDVYNKERKHDHQLSISIGTTYYDPCKPCSVDELLQQADALMYEQKMLKHTPQLEEIKTKSHIHLNASELRHRIESDIISVLLIKNSSEFSNSIEKLLKKTDTCTFDVASAKTIAEGLGYLTRKNIDVILLDLNLPSCNNRLGILKEIKAEVSHVPIIVLTALEDEDLAVQAIREGAQDSITKQDMDNDTLVRSVRHAIERSHAELELKGSFGKFMTVLEETISTLASIVEMRDPYTTGHQRRVSQLAQAIAEEMNLTQEQTKSIKMAAMIHDVGKTQVPEDILNKTTKLSNKDMEIVKTHASSGYEILKMIKFPWLIAQIVHQHHERLNGSGYPKGITDKHILLESKILAVADVIEAMMSDRPYRQAPGIDKALDEIKQNRGKLYDPDVVDNCIGLFKNNKFTFRKLPHDTF